MLERVSDRLLTFREQGTSVDDSIDSGYDSLDLLNSSCCVDTDTTLDPTDSAGKTPTHIIHCI